MGYLSEHADPVALAEHAMHAGVAQQDAHAHEHEQDVLLWRPLEPRAGTRAGDVVAANSTPYRPRKRYDTERLRS